MIAYRGVRHGEGDRHSPQSWCRLRIRSLLKGRYYVAAHAIGYAQPNAQARCAFMKAEGRYFQPGQRRSGFSTLEAATFMLSILAKSGGFRSSRRKFPVKFERLSDADYDPAGQLLTLTGVTAEGSRAEVSLSAQSPDQFIAWLVGSIQRDGQGNSAVLSDKIGFSMVENPDHGGPILLFQIYFAGRPISFGVPLPKSVGRQQIQTIGEQFQTALALVERLSSSAN